MLKDIKKATLIILFSILLLESFSTTNALAHNEQDIDSLVKSAYLIKIIQFIYWPDKLNTQAKLEKTGIDLCVYGDYFFNTLKNNQDQLNISSNNINISSLDINSLNSNSCDIVYFDAASINISTEEAISFISKNTITVSDRKDFAKQGGMIELKTAAKTISIVINMYSVESSHAKLSSDLLEVAEVTW